MIHEAITSGKLAGVALDAFDPEPPDVGHPLFKLPQCITSPHVHGMTPRAMERILETMAMDMAAGLNGGRPKHVANPQVFS